MRPLLKPIRDEKRTRLKKFERKIEHYREKQKLTPVQEPVNDFGSLIGKTVTRVPRRLVEYTGLSIFGGTQALPKKEPTVGAFIGSKSLVFTEDEQLVLDKDPKFSVRTSVDIMDFKIELERMCGKQRYGQFENDKDFSKRPKIITAEQGEIKLRLEEERAKTGDDTELHLDPRIKDLEDEWNKMNESLVYDPIKNRIDFNKRRVSDYKHNKRVVLPAPMSNDKEFECELRKNLYLQAFNEYLKDGETKKKDACKGGHGQKDKKEILNLTEKELRVFKSLKKRVKMDEIVITSTDKSGRIAVLTKDQFIEAGEVHTAKDQQIGWNDIKYLQGQINSHTWWISGIVGNSSKTDPARMKRNIKGYGYQIPEMSLLVKDHKPWQEISNKPVPTRPVLSGNDCLNTHLSDNIENWRK